MTRDRYLSLQYTGRQSPIWEAKAQTDRLGKYHVTMQQMQNEVSAMITDQRPQYWSSKPDTEGYPFTAYHVYIPRTIEQIAAEIKI